MEIKREIKTLFFCLTMTLIPSLALSSAIYNYEDQEVLVLYMDGPNAIKNLLCKDVSPTRAWVIVTDLNLNGRTALGLKECKPHLDRAITPETMKNSVIDVKIEAIETILTISFAAQCEAQEPAPSTYKARESYLSDLEKCISPQQLRKLENLTGETLFTNFKQGVSDSIIHRVDRKEFASHLSELKEYSTRPGPQLKLPSTLVIPAE